MEKIELDNFRIFNEKLELDLSPITILTGKNNSGKSSIIKGLLLLDVILNSNDQFFLDFSEKNQKHKINNFQNAINWSSIKKSFSLGFSTDDIKIQIGYLNYNENLAVLNSLKISNSNRNINISLEKKPTSTDLKYQLKFNEGVISYLKQRIEINDIKDSITHLEKRISRKTKDLEKNKEELKYLNEQYNLLIKSREILETINEIEIDYNDIKSSSKSIAEIIGLNLNDWNILNSSKDEIQNSNNYSNRIDFNKNIFELTKNIEAINIKNEKNINLNLKLLNEYKYTNLKNRNLFDNSFSIVYFLRAIMIYNAEHLSPNRTRQERLYIKNTAQTEIENEIEAFSKIPMDSIAKEFLQKWLREFSLGDKISVEPIEGVAYKVKIHDDRKSTDIVDMGFGTGQILTILLKIVNTINRNRGTKKLMKYIKSKSNSKKPIIIIEEPESNLHPQFQSKIAELIVESFLKFNIQFVVETHSEYLIRKLQLLIGQQYEDLRPTDVLIYYLDTNNPIIDEKLKKISILNNGALSNRFGTGFLDEATTQALQLMKLKNRTEL